MPPATMRVFQRDEHNLICQCPISFARAALGGPVELTTLTNDKVTVEVPRGAQTHVTVVRIPGHGMPGAPDSRRAWQKGDLLVQLVVETPTKLSARQREILEQFRETETGDECPNSRGFFQKIKVALGA